MRNIPVIQSEGDFEIVILHETHSALAELIGPDLYKIAGVAPEQSIKFHNQVSFNYFFIQLVEFVAEGVQSACIDGKFKNHSLISGLRWFCNQHETEATESKLGENLQFFETWVEDEVPIEFRCSFRCSKDDNENIRLILKNRQLISFCANTTKHNLLRLSRSIGTLEKLCANSRYNFNPQELSAVLTEFISEVNNRLLYHSSHLVELLANIFFSLNSIIKKRYQENPTNRAGEVIMPDGVTSEIFKDKYGKVLVFNCYEDTRITDYTPKTTKYLKMRYQ